MPGRCRCSAAKLMLKASRGRQQPFAACVEGIVRLAGEVPLDEFAREIARWADIVDENEPHDDSKRKVSLVEVGDQAIARIEGGLDGNDIIRAYLEAVDRPDPDDAPDGPRTRGQRCYDHVIDLFRRGLADALGDDPLSGGGLDVIVDAQTVAEIEAHPDLSLDDMLAPFAAADIDELRVRMLEHPDGRPATRKLVEMMLCTGMIRRIIIDPATGATLDVGRAQRRYTPRQHRALAIRDGGCAFPGCDRPPRWCDAHHLKEWEHGGPTDLDNGVLLCRRHHRLVHHTDWSLRRDPRDRDHHRHRTRRPRVPPRTPTPTTRAATCCLTPFSTNRMTSDGPRLRALPGMSVTPPADDGRMGSGRMDRQARRARLAELMARLADGDGTAAFSLALEFSGSIGAAVRDHLAELGVHDPDREEVDELVLDVCVMLADVGRHVAAPTAGASPWQWAWHRVRNVVSGLGRPARRCPRRRAPGTGGRVPDAGNRGRPPPRLRAAGGHAAHRRPRAARASRRWPAPGTRTSCSRSGSRSSSAIRHRRSRSRRTAACRPRRSVRPSRAPGGASGASPRRTSASPSSPTCPSPPDGASDVPLVVDVARRVGQEGRVAIVVPDGRAGHAPVEVRRGVRGHNRCGCERWPPRPAGTRPGS